MIQASTLRQLLHCVFLLILVSVTIATSTFAQDEIGVYWDQGFAENQTTTSGPYELVTGYVVIHNPTSGGGILAWECEFDLEGPAVFASWSLEGQTINAASPPAFAVGLAAPLPPSADTQVASFQLLVTEVAPVAISVKPLFFASIPQQMSYLGGDNPEDLTIMNSVTGTPLVATVNEEVPVAQLSRTGIQFGEVALGQSVTETIQVANVGGGTLPLNITLACTGPGFSLTGLTGPISVAAGALVTIHVTYSPFQVGLVECTLQLGDIAPDVPMAGTGREPIVSWVPPSNIDFGNVPVGAVRITSTSLRNNGEAPLQMDVGWDDICSDFDIISNLGTFTLIPNRVRSVNVRFSPTEPGPFACSLSFGPDLPSVTVTGTAFFETPDYSIEPSLVSFPTTNVGASRTQIVRITNQGSGSFTVDPRLAAVDGAFELVGGDELADLAPGMWHDILVQFSPPAEEYYTNTLIIDDSLPGVPVNGAGGEAVLQCDVSADQLDFMVNTVGESQSAAVTISNLGNVSLALNPLLDSTEFSLFGDSVDLAPGGQANYLITYQPTTFGVHTATIILGPAACTSISLSGSVGIDFEPDENLVGFFFDPEFTSFETGVAVGTTNIPVYLALINPSENSGVGGWECRVETTGSSSFVGWDLAGDAVNAANPNDPNEFTVGIGLDPLPYAADGILLATFDLYVDDPDPNNVTLELHPKRAPSIPGMMAWVPWSDFEQIMPMLPFTGQPTVAWLNTGTPVSLEMPLPLVQQTGGQVDLQWPSQGLVSDGYHVYRKDQQGVEKRLTTALLPTTTTVVQFSDRPDYPAGTVLRYSYAAILDGSEIARSNEVQVTVDDLPQVRSQLLSNVPNPFNPQTQIRFQLMQNQHARITVYDMTGRRVRTLVDEQRSAGGNSVTWQGRDDAGRPVASGAYYVRLETNGAIDHRKIMMLK